MIDLQPLFPLLNIAVYFDLQRKRSIDACVVASCDVFDTIKIFKKYNNILFNV